MKTSADSLREYFLDPQQGMAAKAFKSEGEASHQGQRTFQELIESTEMSDEQRQLLLQDCNDDELALEVTRQAR